jgi:hypothetical protein
MQMYSCISTMKAITVEIHQHASGVARYAELKVYSRETSTPVQLPTNKQLIKTNVGTSARSFYLNACNIFGCSNTITTQTSAPFNGPSVTSFAVAETNKVEVIFEPPTDNDNGGASITHMKAILEPIFHQTGDTTLNRQQFDLPSSNNWQTTIPKDAPNAGSDPSARPYALVEMQACNVYGCSSVTTAASASLAMSSTLPPCSSNAGISLFEYHGVCWLITCDAGEYRSVTECASMSNHPSCPAGQSYSSASATQGFKGSTADDATCTPCVAGKYNEVVDGHASCKACVGGKYSDAGISQTSETTCKACAAGKYSNSGESQISETVCTECVAGKYSDVGQTSEDDCQDCIVGRYADNTGTAVCKDCPRGYYVTTNAQLSCTGCVIGKYGRKHIERKI